MARIERMGFEPGRIVHMREMMLGEDEEARRKAVMKLLPFQKKDFLGIFKAMAGKPVTIRLLDPPLHEFLTLTADQVTVLANKLGIDQQKIHERIRLLHELNPMLGHRGCRLGISYPEITEMQAQALFEAAAELTTNHVKVLPAILVPLVAHPNHFSHQAPIFRTVAWDVML